MMLNNNLPYHVALDTQAQEFLVWKNDTPEQIGRGITIQDAIEALQMGK